MKPLNKSSEINALNQRGKMCGLAEQSGERGKGENFAIPHCAGKILSPGAKLLVLFFSVILTSM